MKKSSAGWLPWNGISSESNAMGLLYFMKQKSSVILINENENKDGEKRQNNEFVNEN